MSTLEAGIKALADSDQWRRYLKAQAAFHAYSYANTLLILFQKPEATRVAGFRTWLKLGRHVRKGERGIFILAPVFARKKAEDGQQVQQDANGDAAEARVVCFKLVAVFDVSQTDGEDLPAPVQKLTGDTAGDLYDRLAVFSATNGCPVTVEVIDGSANGFYAPRDHRIVIREGLAPDQAAKTLAHEIAHSILHREPEVYAARRGDCELEAESVAFVVLHHFGIDTGAYSFGYVTTWAGGDDEAIKGLKTSAARIQATARKVIDGISAEHEAEVVQALLSLMALLT
jgi:antirestriction protein ArdC